jgi:hypothetical protein
LDAWNLTDDWDRRWVGSMICDFPLRCFNQPANLPKNAAAPLPRAYVLCTDSEAVASFLPFAKQARTEGWYYAELPTGHEAMITEPRSLASLLLDFAKRQGP